VITDRELLLLKGHGGVGVMPTYYWRYLFSQVLEREITDAETWDAISRLNGPGEPGTVWGDVVRSQEVPFGRGRKLR
jgi:hypothetical protein